MKNIGKVPRKFLLTLTRHKKFPFCFIPQQFHNTKFLLLFMLVVSLQFFKTRLRTEQNYFCLINFRCAVPPPHQEILSLYQFYYGKFINIEKAYQNIFLFPTWEKKIYEFYVCFLMIPTYVATLWMYQMPSLFPLTSHFKTFIHRLITFPRK